MKYIQGKRKKEEKVEVEREDDQRDDRRKGLAGASRLDLAAGTLITTVQEQGRAQLNSKVFN